MNIDRKDLVLLLDTARDWMDDAEEAEEAAVTGDEDLDRWNEGRRERLAQLVPLTERLWLELAGESKKEDGNG